MATLVLIIELEIRDGNLINISTSMSLKILDRLIFEWNIILNIQI